MPRRSRSRSKKSRSRSRSRSRSPGGAKTGYCVRCRTKKSMVGAHVVTIRNRRGGQKALAGKCPSCGTKMFRFIKN